MKKKSRLQKLSLYGLILLSAIFYSVSFAPWFLWPLGFISFVPVFILFKKQDFHQFSKKKAILFGMFYSLLVSIFGYHWILYTVQEFGHLPLVPALFIFLLYSIFLNTRFVFLFLFSFMYLKKIDKNPIQKDASIIKKIFYKKWLMLSGIWAISEFIGWQLFPAYGSNIVSGNNVFIQIIDVFGVRFTSTIWFFFNFVFYEIYLLTRNFIKEEYFDKLSNQIKEKNFKADVKIIKQKVLFYLKKLVAHKLIISGLLLFFIIHIYGLVTISYWSEKQKNFSVKHIGIPQGNTPLAFYKIRDKIGFLQNKIKEMVDQSIVIVEKAKASNKSIDLMIWPESSVPFLSYKGRGSLNSLLRQEIGRFHDHSQIPLIFNDIDFAVSNGRIRHYSNMSLISSDARIKYFYHKIFLLPFGEYMPLGNVFPSIKSMFPEVSDFDFGKSFQLFKHNGMNMLPVICYEIIPSSFILNFYQKTNRQANILINITNDAWFGDSIESEQHLELGRLRAIELRLPLVRATNTGVTAFIDVTGRVHGKTKQFVKVNKIYDVPVPQNSFTLFSFWGNLFYYITIILVLGMFVIFNIKQKVIKTVK